MKHYGTLVVLSLMVLTKPQQNTLETKLLSYTEHLKKSFGTIENIYQI